MAGRSRKGGGGGGGGVGYQFSPCTNHVLGLISSLLVNSGFNKTFDSRPWMDKFLIMFTVSSLVALV